MDARLFGASESGEGGTVDIFLAKKMRYMKG